MSERLRINVDFVTQQAAENAAAMVQTMHQIKASAADAGQAVDRAEQQVKDLGQALDKTGDEAKQTATQTTDLAKAIDDAVRFLDEQNAAATEAARTLDKAGQQAGQAATKIDKVGDEAAQTAKRVAELERTARGMGGAVVDASGKAAAGIGGIGRAGAGVSGVLTTLASNAKGFVAGFLGLQGIIELFERLRENMEKVEEIRTRLIEGKTGLETSMQQFIANLGLPNDTPGQNKAKQIVADLRRRTPQASLDVLMEVAGQSQAFGFDVTKPGAGADVNALFSAYAASTQLSAEEAGNLPRIAKALGVTNAPQARRMLAQIRAAQEKTGISSQTEFTRQFLRLGAQFIPQGMGIEEVGGLLAGSAPGATDSRTIGTNAEQAMRAAMGKDEDAQAALGQRALAQGAFSESDVARSAASFAPAMEKKDALANAAMERDVAQKQAERTRKENEYRTGRKRDEARLAKLRRDPRKQAEADVLEESMANKAAAHQAALDTIDGDVAEKQAKLGANRADVAAGARRKALAQQYRQLAPGQRLRVVREAAAPMSQAERGEFFTGELKASQEEVGSLSVLVEGGASAYADAEAAVRQAGPQQEAQVDQGIQGYAQSTLGRQTAAREAVRFEEYSAVGSEDEAARLLRERSKSRADILIQRRKEGQAQVDGELAVNNVEFTQRAVFRRDVQRQIGRFWGGMSKEERAAHPEFAQIVLEVASAVNNTTGGNARSMADIESAYRKFYRAARVVVAERAQGRFKTRTAAPEEHFFVNEVSGAASVGAPGAAPRGTTEAVGPRGVIELSPRNVPVDPDALDKTLGGSIPPLEIDPAAAVEGIRQAAEQGTLTPEEQRAIESEDAATGGGGGGGAAGPLGPVSYNGGGGRGGRTSIINVNIGQYVTPAGADGDMAGRLEGFGYDV